MLIDLTNDFYIARFSSKVDFEGVMFNGPWIINDYYLHVRCWEPNFMAKMATIDSLFVWVRFPVIPVEYFNEKWLLRAGNRIGRSVKVDCTSLSVTRGKFARVCVEIDMTKPLKSGYTLRGRVWPMQYEGLHALCFHCGRYGHLSNICPALLCESSETHHEGASAGRSERASTKEVDAMDQISGGSAQASYGAWMTATKNRRGRDGDMRL